MLQLVSVGVTVTIVHETAIARVDSEYTSCVLDRAPVLLGTRSDLPDVREYTVRIRAIRAIELLKRVEVAELLAVECHIVDPAHAWDPIDREANRLVDGDKQVEQYHRNKERIDHRCGKNHGWTSTEDVAQQPRFQKTV